MVCRFADCELMLSSGSAAVDVKADIFILDDTNQGVGLYKMSTCERIKTFDVPTKVACRVRTVAFHDQLTAVVCGSDHGQVYVFERRLGVIRDVLHIGFDDWVQTITVGPAKTNILLIYLPYSRPSILKDSRAVLLVDLVKTFEETTRYSCGSKKTSSCIQRPDIGLYSRGCGWWQV